MDSLMAVRREPAWARTTQPGTAPMEAPLRCPRTTRPERWWVVVDSCLPGGRATALSRRQRGPIAVARLSRELLRTARSCRFGSWPQPSWCLQSGSQMLGPEAPRPSVNAARYVIHTRRLLGLGPDLSCYRLLRFVVPRVVMGWGQVGLLSTKDSRGLGGRVR